MYNIFLLIINTRFIQTCLRHPDSPLALGNRNGVFKCMRTAMATLKEIVQENSYELPPESCRGLGMEFKDFEVILQIIFTFINIRSLNLVHKI